MKCNVCNRKSEIEFGVWGPLVAGGSIWRLLTEGVTHVCDDILWRCLKAAS